MSQTRKTGAFIEIDAKWIQDAYGGKGFSYRRLLPPKESPLKCVNIVLSLRNQNNSFLLLVQENKLGGLVSGFRFGDNILENLRQILDRYSDGYVGFYTKEDGSAFIRINGKDYLCSMGYVDREEIELRTEKCHTIRVYYIKILPTQQQDEFAIINHIANSYFFRVGSYDKHNYTMCINHTNDRYKIRCMINRTFDPNIFSWLKGIRRLTISEIADCY